MYPRLRRSPRRARPVNRVANRVFAPLASPLCALPASRHSDQVCSQAVSPPRTLLLNPVDSLPRSPLRNRVGSPLLSRPSSPRCSLRLSRRGLLLGSGSNPMLPTRHGCLSRSTVPVSTRLLVCILRTVMFTPLVTMGTAGCYLPPQPVTGARWHRTAQVAI